MKKLFALGAVLVSAVAASAPASVARSGDCRPVRAVFYESSDWLRIAQGLGANPSACADYFITVPALAADKTQMVNNRASQVRAQGPNFHAAAEINYGAWAKWVSATGNSFYSAGVEARQRMAAAGFDVSAGDTWALNELTSSVRSNSGSARQNVRDLIRGLYDGSGAPVKGIVFAVGVGQNSVSFPVYKSTMESWLQDQNFWADMTSYASDFFQETYGDVRNYAIAGASPDVRAGYLNAFLQHPLSLAQATAAPTAAVGARNFLTASYGPLANASWAWNTSYGFTNVGSDVMADYISAQTYAMRLTGETRIGFAWNPLNNQGLSADDFTSQVAALVARLAASIHDTDGGDATQACIATGCSSVVQGAVPVTGWSTFSTWTPTAAVFTNPPATMVTGTTSIGLTLQLQTGSVATSLPNPTTVTVTSNSPSTVLTADPVNGPWTPSLTLAIPPWTGGATFYALSSSVGSVKVTANLAGQLSSQVETVSAPAPTTTTTTTTTVTTPAVVPAPTPAFVKLVTLTRVAKRLHAAVKVVDSGGRALPSRISFWIIRGTAIYAGTHGATKSDGTLGLTTRGKPTSGCYGVRVKQLDAPGHIWDGVSPATQICIKGALTSRR